VRFTLLLALAPGCGLIQAALDQESRPTARVQGVHIQDLSLSGLTLLFDVEIENHATGDLPLLDVDYQLESRGRTFVEGRADLQGTVPGNGSKTVSLPVGVKFADLLSILEGVRPGAVVPYQARLSLGADVPVLGKISLPLSREGEVPVPTVPDIEVAQLHWEKLSLTEAAATVDLRIVQTNDFPIDLGAMSYDLALAGTEIARGQLGSGARLEAGTETLLPIRISFSPQKFGLALFGILSGREAAYRLGGTLDASTPFGKLAMPFTREGVVSLRTRTGS
jgi:LEA14-like dessication related protein